MVLSHLWILRLHLCSHVLHMLSYNALFHINAKLMILPYDAKVLLFSRNRDRGSSCPLIQKDALTLAKQIGLRGQSCVGMAQIAYCKCTFKLAREKEKVIFNDTDCLIDGSYGFFRCNGINCCNSGASFSSFICSSGYPLFDIHFHFDSNWHCNLRLLNDPWIMSQGKKWD